MKRLRIATIVLGALALGTACTSSSKAVDAAAGSGASVVVDTGTNPSMEFKNLYTNVLAVKCSPCHTTQANKPPNGNPLDMSDVLTAYFSLTTVSTKDCPNVPDKRRVVSGGQDLSYLIRKLMGTQPMGCGMRMPRTAMRTEPPGCADPTDAAAASSDASPAVDGSLGDGGGDAAAAGGDAAAGVSDATVTAPQPPPRACLTAAEITAVRTWINNGAF